MKTALILFGDENVYSDNYLSNVLKTFSDGGIKTDVVEVLSNSDDLRFKRRLTEFKDTVDFLTVLDNGNLLFDLKQTVADSMDAVLVENENARKFITAIEKVKGENYPEEMSLMPMEASVIPNLTGAYQGFVLDKEEFTVAVVPSDFEQFSSMFSEYLLPLMEKKFELKNKRLTLKYFGDVDKLLSVLSEARENTEVEFSYSIKEKYGDFTVSLLFDENAEDYETHKIVRYVVGELRDDIYAEFDTTLGERLIDVLRLYKLKISTAESFTAGRIASELIKTSGASNYVHEGIVAYSNTSKADRLGVLRADIQKEGVVSSTVAYEMAVGLLKTGNCDAAVATTGIAGPTSDESGKPVGLCYIAVGTLNGVHTYKYNFSGSREEITETAKNTALFLAIKNLKGLKR